ncbi:unnamed protein product [Dicrocoelium dendriticum]|nr:unnamed protein product [Dicrocoelium dendriticum]
MLHAQLKDGREIRWLVCSNRHVEKFATTVEGTLSPSHPTSKQFNSHSDEDNPVRIAQIIHKAIEDMDWLLKKYSS